LLFGQGKGINSDVRGQLSKIKTSIKVKQLEKDRLVLQEKIFKKELISINKNIEQNKKKLTESFKDVRIVQDNLEESSKIFNSALAKSISLNRIILKETRLFNKMSLRFSYEKNPVEYKIRRKSLEYKIENFEKEKNVTKFSAANVKKWSEFKKNILNLQVQKKSLLVQSENELRKKKKILEATLNKRSVAEKEIKSLNKSADTLQVLIKKTSIAADKKKRSTPTNAQIKEKKCFLWPVKGEVVAKFGKNKHLELDTTYKIDCGMMIKAADFSQVKSAKDGVVIFTGQHNYYGKAVAIHHGDSDITIYGLLTNILVKQDKKVLKGTVIAELGAGDKNVLFFGAIRNRIFYDPMPSLQS
jgi:murein DD-endopeptidase MepM/ murein hydrolase activator NlpD